jgi:hypothetical protein
MAAFAQTAAPAADALRASVQRLSTATANEQRFDAMTAMLTLHTSEDVIDKIDAAAMARQADFTLSLVRRLLARP